MKLLEIQINNDFIYNLIEAGLFILGLFLAKKEAKRDVNGVIKMIKEIVGNLENEISILKDSRKKSDSQKTFEKNIVNSITGKANTKINESILSENKCIVNSLTVYFDEIAEYCLKFYNSNQRKNDDVTKKELTANLTNGIDSIMNELTETLSKGIKIEKGFKTGNKLSSITFIELLASQERKEYNCFQLNTNLVSKLADNGLDETGLKTLFMDYTVNFLDEFKDKYKRFNEMKDFETLIEEI